MSESTPEADGYTAAEVADPVIITDMPEFEEVEPVVPETLDEGEEFVVEDPEGAEG